MTTENQAPEGAQALTATELSEMWRLACADWNAQIGAQPDPWEHFAARVAVALAAQPVATLPAQEAVAWIRPSGRAMLEAGGYCTVYASEGMSNHSTPLYAAQPQAPLSERAILDLVPSTMPMANDFDLLWFARAVERAHGIQTKEPTNG